VGFEPGRHGQPRGVPYPRGISDGEGECASAGAESTVGLPILGATGSSVIWLVIPVD